MILIIVLLSYFLTGAAEFLKIAFFGVIFEQMQLQDPTIGYSFAYILNAFHLRSVGEIASGDFASESILNCLRRDHGCVNTFAVLLQLTFVATFSAGPISVRDVFSF